MKFNGDTHKKETPKKSSAPKDAAAHREGAPGQQKKRRVPVVAIVLCAVLGVLLIAVAAYMIWEDAPATPTGGLSTPSVSSTPSAEPTTTAEPTPTATPDDSDKAGMYTFVVVGTDKVGANTDTILVGRLDTVNHTLNVVSIPRDTLVNIPESVKKVNALYAYGVNENGDGPARLKSGLRDLLGFEVGNYAVVNLTAFVDIIDAIGGVDYNVPVNMYYDDPGQDLHISLSAGYQHLNGEQAMGVVRFRSGYATADIGRIGTQQDFLKSVAKQLLTLGNIPNLSKVISIVENNVVTDLTSANISYFVRQLLLCSADDINFYTLPGNYGDSVGGFSYVSIYIDDWLQMVNDYLNPYSEKVTYSNVNILTHSSSGFYSTVGYVSGGEGSFLTMEAYLGTAATEAPTATEAPAATDAPAATEPVTPDDGGGSIIG